MDLYESDMKMHKLDDERPTVKLNLYFRVSLARNYRVVNLVEDNLLLTME